MKTNFNSKLFEKQINLNKQNQFFGGSGSSSTSYTQTDCDALDSVTSTFDENGCLIAMCEFNPC